MKNEALTNHCYSVSILNFELTHELCDANIAIPAQFSYLAVFAHQLPDTSAHSSDTIFRLIIAAPFALSYLWVAKQIKPL